ncbi:MFS transporter [Halomarina salina]|uniref:MFS transporter n=1 Tax=Halomarina salina TaxID=1872699 RepID=A0ABD5RHR2_9EURY|nr:MFS transporter [Halomarina salina]
MSTRLAERTARIPWDSPTVRVVLASTFLAPLGVPLISPALPVVRDAFGVGDAQASLLVSAYFLTGILLSPFIGALTDRIGRQRVLVGSLLVFGLTGGAIAAAPSFEWVVGLRVVQGTAAAGIFVTTVTLIADAYEGAQRNAVLGANIAVLSGGAALFPVVGGALVAISWNTPFLLYLVALPMALVAWTTLDESVGVNDRRGFAYVRGALSSLPAVDAVALYGAAFGLELLLFGSIVTGVPFLLAAEGVLPVIIGLVLLSVELAAIPVSMLNGRFAERFTNEHLIAAGFACFGVGLSVMWVAPSVAVVAAGAFVFGAGLGLSMPAIDAAVSGLVTAEHRAGALSLRNSATFLGRATGPVLFAGIAATTGYGPLLLTGAAIAVLSGGLALLVGRVVRRRRVPVEEVDRPARGV